MQKILTALAVLVSLTGAAAAADIYGSKDGRAIVAASPVENARASFAGAYAGASVSWNNLNVEHGGTLAFPDDLTVDGFTYGEAFAAGRLEDVTDEAFRFGVQVGRNWQVGRLYGGPRLSVDFGKLEGEISRTDVIFDNESNEFPVNAQHDGRLSVSMDYLAAASLKLGVALTDNVGVYGIAGVSAADVDVSARGSFSGRFGETAFSNQLPSQAAYSETAIGYHYGGGVDFTMGSWNVFAEYVRHDLGSVDTKGTVLGGLVQYTHEADVIVDQVKAGVNYRW